MSMKQELTAPCSLRSGVNYQKQELIEAVRREAALLLQEGRLSETKGFIQHADLSVYQHCCHVAYICCVLSVRMKLDVSWREMIRGALLHDYFLYDWHDTPPFNFRHAFGHPTMAMKNAMADYELTIKERQIIQRHMWPLTFMPPTCKEAWMIVLADKICTVLEVFRKERVRL